jgi:serine-type D-Ala-D-Ala carboxypeptidase (penicillin-binding protein 5/6)
LLINSALFKDILMVKISKFKLSCAALSVGAVFVLLKPADAIETIAREAIMVDVDTGETMLEKGADVSMPPASMSKLMTLYILFQRLRDGSIKLDDTFTVSENAWRKGGAKSGSSTMFLVPGKKVKIEDLIRGIIVQSGNDACIVVAENLAGSEAAFAEEMTLRAREIGMTNSTFKNATGWPHPEHRMTARDLAILAKRTIADFPEYYHYYQETEFTYNKIKQHNRNPLLYKDIGADGLKTGHTKEAGYGLTASAKRGDRRLILVINGLKSKKARTIEPERLLQWGLREFNNYALFKAGETVDTASVWLGTSKTVPLIIDRDVKITLPRKSRKSLKVSVKFIGPIPAPIAKGTKVATLSIVAPGRETMEIPLTAGGDVEQLGLFGRLGAAFNSIIWGHSG